MHVLNTIIIINYHIAFAGEYQNVEVVRKVTVVDIYPPGAELLLRFVSVEEHLWTDLSALNCTQKRMS